MKIPYVSSLQTLFRTPLALLAGVLFFSLALTYSVSAQDGAVAAAPAAAAADPAVAAGEAVYVANCKQCHKIDEVVVGPALRDAHKRWPSEAELAGFIKYPQKVIDGGKNAYAKGLYDKYKQYMPNHDFLKDDDIKNVIAWIKAESAKAPVVAAAAPAAGGDAKGGEAAGSGVDSSYLTILLVGLIVIMAFILLVLSLLTTVISRHLAGRTDLSEEDREFAEQRTNWLAIFNSPVFRGIVTAIFVIAIVKVSFDKVYAIGIQQGYAPKQPIPFSHKLHAGKYQIDCGYCHTGAYINKSATIPSVNICMNCHNAIKTDNENIKQIWRAVERNQPIEWVRIHNLPDHAYFNHSQHTVVGGIECTTCHGPIQEMEVVEQHSSLTMGWCINCHRETVVKTEGNAYYDKLVELHKESSKEPMKVQNIGGLECSKCHY